MKDQFSEAVLEAVSIVLAKPEQEIVEIIQKFPQAANDNSGLKALVAELAKSDNRAIQEALAQSPILEVFPEFISTLAERASREALYILLDNKALEKNPDAVDLASIKLIKDHWDTEILLKLLDKIELLKANPSVLEIIAKIRGEKAIVKLYSTPLGNPDEIFIKTPRYALAFNTDALKIDPEKIIPMMIDGVDPETSHNHFSFLNELCGSSALESSPRAVESLYDIVSDFREPGAILAANPAIKCSPKTILKIAKSYGKTLSSNPSVFSSPKALELLIKQATEGNFPDYEILKNLAANPGIKNMPDLISRIPDLALKLENGDGCIGSETAGSIISGLVGNPAIAKRPEVIELFHAEWKSLTSGNGSKFGYIPIVDLVKNSAIAKCPEIVKDLAQSEDQKIRDALIENAEKNDIQIIKDIISYQSSAEGQALEVLGLQM